LHILGRFKSYQHIPESAITASSASKATISNRSDIIKSLVETLSGSKNQEDTGKDEI